MNKSCRVALVALGFVATLTVFRAVADEIASPEAAYQYLKDRLVYIEARQVDSMAACSPDAKGPAQKGTGILLNGRYVLTSFHVVDVHLKPDKKHCFLVYREMDRAVGLPGTPRYVSGTFEPRLRLGDQDVALFPLARPVTGLEECLPILDDTLNAGHAVFIVGYRGDEIDLEAARPISEPRKYRGNLLGNCLRTGVCEVGGGVPEGHSGSPVIDSAGRLVGVVKGDETAVGQTKIEPLLALRQAVLAFCDGRVRAPKTAGLELVDVSFAKRDTAERFPVLDVKVRNTGEVAFIKKAIFDVKRVWQIQSGWLPGNVCASWNYDVLLPILNEPNPVLVKMSQEVKTGETDRFTFTLGNDAPPGLEEYAFLVDVTLLYNEDERPLTLPTLFFVAESAKSNAARNSGGDFQSAFRHNVRIVDELGAFAGVMNEEAQNFLYYHSERVVPRHLEHLASTIPSRRIGAANALGLLRHAAKRALTSLEAVAEQDPSSEVREAARSAIKDIREAVTEQNSRHGHTLAPLTIDKDQILKAKDYCINAASERDVAREEPPPDRHVNDRVRRYESQEDLASQLAYEADDLFRADQFAEAITKATQAIKLGSDTAYFVRGRAHLATHQDQKAIEDFSYLIQNKGDYYEWNRANRALAYRRLGQIDKARVDYDKAVEIGGRRDADVVASRGAFLLEVGESRAAVADFRSAIALEPENVGHYASLAEALIIDGQYGDVAVAAAQIRELAPEEQSANAYLLLGELFETISRACQGKDISEAKNRFSRQLQTRPKLLWSFEDLEKWMSETDCPPQALTTVREMLSLLRPLQ